jgi:hypothetical protein
MIICLANTILLYKPTEAMKLLFTAKNMQNICLSKFIGYQLDLYGYQLVVLISEHKYLCKHMQNMVIMKFITHKYENFYPF